MNEQPRCGARVNSVAAEHFCTRKVAAWGQRCHQHGGARPTRRCAGCGRSLGLERHTCRWCGGFTPPEVHRKETP